METNPEEVIKDLQNQIQEINWLWREEIEKYLPQISLMSFYGPKSTIKWLMEHVDIKPEYKKMADEWNKRLKELEQECS